MKQRLMVAACAVVVSAPVASASTFPFVVFDVFAGGSGNPGQPIQSVGGNFYQDPNGSDFPPTSGAIDSFPALEFDSYVALDPLTASSTSYEASGPGMSNISFGPNVLSGTWGSANGVMSSQGPFFGLQSVFIARLTVPAGAGLDVPSIAVNVDSEGGGPQFFQGPLTIIDEGEDRSLSLFGGADRGGGAEYDFLSLRMPTSFSPGADGRGMIQSFDVYDIYVVAVPAPGSLAILALSGVVIGRRRR